MRKENTVDELLTVEEAAVRLGVAQVTIRSWILRRRIGKYSQLFEVVALFRPAREAGLARSHDEDVPQADGSLSSRVLMKRLNHELGLVG
jgi:hypothetical protein